MQSLGDLDRQLTRRDQHEGLDGILPRLEVVEDRQAKGSSLAGAGVGLADHIVAGQQERDQGRLDRGRGGKAKRFYGLHQLRVQVQTGKFGRHRFSQWLDQQPLYKLFR